MSMIRFLIVGASGIIVTFLFVPLVFATSSDFLAKATEYYQQNCTKNLDRITRSTAILCYLYDKAHELDAAIRNIEQEQTNQAALLDNLQTNVSGNTADITDLKEKKTIVDFAQVRGAGLDIDAPTTTLKVPGEVTVNCTADCTLWVNYDVDTRNTQIPGDGSWHQHLYHIFINDVDQAVYNQVSATVPNAAYPVAVNGVFPVSAGQHTVSIYVKVTGGHLQQFTSHLQVMAIQ